MVLLWLLPVLASSACGGRATQTNPADETGGRAGAAIAGAASIAEDCSSYADQAEHTVKLRITNGTGRALYFGPTRVGSGPTPPFELRDAADTFLSLPNVEACPTRCADVMAGAEGCQHPTPIQSARRLLSKDTMELAWPGTFLRGSTLSIACQPSGATAPVACQQAVAAPAGVYTFAARASTSVSCSPNDCRPCADDDAECFIPGGIIGSPPLQAKLSVDLDASYGLSSASGSGPTSLPAVQLTFEP